MFHRTNKNNNIILRKLYFLLSGYFNIRCLWDAYRMPTWMDFGLKNPPKSALGRLLGRLLAVLGRLGTSWSALETSWKNIEKLSPKKWQQKSAKNASSDVIGNFLGSRGGWGLGRPCAGDGRGFRSGALNYHLPTKKITQQRQRRKTKDERWTTPTHAVAQSAVADIYIYMYLFIYITIYWNV